ncbi:MAG: VOC family protein [Anaerolineae bacterium]
MNRIAIVQIRVTEVEQAVAFYRDVLGLVEVPRVGDRDTVEMAGAGVPLLLVRGRPAGKACGTMLWFQTNDLTQTLEEYARLGVDVIHHLPQPCPMGIYASFRDPSGNVHAVVQFLA